MVDYARLWEFDIDYLLTHEVSPTSFYLTKDGNLPKSMKSKLARELKKYLGEPYPTEVSKSDLKTMIVIDFMAFARKISIKKMSLVTYADFFNVLWKMFPSSYKGCDHIDVVFDLYLENSIKEDERHRRSKAQLIETNIATPKQQLPV